jgi:ribonuclease P protein component
MLPKNNRLKKERDFKRILRSNKIKEESFFILRILRNDINEVRFGVSVSKKISKKATLRNKIRRRMFALFSLIQPDIKKGTDILLTALPGLEKKGFLETEQIMKKNFEKAGIFKNG